MAYKSNGSLIREMNGSDGNDNALIEDIIDACRYRRIDPYEVLVPKLHGSAQRVWEQPHIKQYIQSSLQQPSGGGGSEWDGEDRAAFLAASLRVCEPYFKVSSEAGGTLYRGVDVANRILVRVGTIEEVGVVATTLAPVMLAEDYPINTKLAAAILGFYKPNTPQIAKPVLFRQPADDPSVWGLAGATIRPDPTMPFPNIETFLARLNDAEAFAAYLWGIYSGCNKGRQILYLYDPVGDSGKSVMLRVVSRAFGTDPDAPGRLTGVVASYNSKTLENSTHASAMFEDKYLVIVGDNKNPNILMSQSMKELSGDDPSTLNPKMKDPFSSYLQCRVIIAGNVAPNITHEWHNQSRTLFLTLEPLPRSVVRDVKWEQRCVAELPGFLSYAEQCYQRRCLHDYEIAVNDRVKEATEARVAMHQERWEDFVEEHFELDKTASLSAPEFNRVLDENAKRWDGYDRDHFKRWLHEVHGVTYKQVRLNGGTDRAWRYAGIRLKGLSSDLPASSQVKMGGRRVGDGLMGGICS